MLILDRYQHPKHAETGQYIAFCRKHEPPVDYCLQCYDTCPICRVDWHTKDTIRQERNARIEMFGMEDEE